MTLKLNVAYDTPGDFTFDSGAIEIAASRAKLLLDFRAQGTFSEAFDSSTGHTFDPAKAEITSSLFRQIDTRPTDAIVGATYTSSVNSSWLGLVAVLNGTPVITSNALVCTGAQGLAYTDASIGATPTVGAIKFKYTPNYTTSPPANVNLVSLEAPSGNANRIVLTNSPSGNNLRLTVSDSSGASVIATAAIGGTYSPTAGNTDEIELNWDTTTGTFRLFLNGVLHGTSTPGTYTRTTTATELNVGATTNVYNRAEASFEDVVLFSTVQHTTGYTPGYTLNETIYVEASDSLPAGTYGGSGNMKPGGPWVATEVGAVRYNVNARYWDGGAWAVSDSSYAQSSTLADINTNIGTFPDTGDTTLVPVVVLPASNSLSSIGQLDIPQLGESYPTDDPTIVPTALALADGLLDFSIDDTVISGLDEIRWVVETKLTQVGPSSYFYHDGAGWVASDQSLAQSNTANEVSTNMPDLDVSAGRYFRMVAILHSDDGFSTPEIGEHTVCYNFFAIQPEPARCILYGWLLEKDDSPIPNATINIDNLAPFKHTGVLVPKSRVTTTTDANGYWEIQVYETETITKTYRVEITYSDPIAKTVKQTIEVPDQDSANFVDLTTGL